MAKAVRTSPIRKLNTIKPVAGHFVVAYFYDSKIGGGIRSLLVLKVGRKYIHLFYSPKLMQINCTRAEWERLAIVGPQEGIIESPRIYRERVQAKANQFAHLGIKFSQKPVRLAIEICGGRYVTPKELAKRVQ